MYRLLHRHRWRRLAPRPPHVKADRQWQEEFKKTPPTPPGSGRGMPAGRAGASTTAMGIEPLQKTASECGTAIERILKRSGVTQGLYWPVAIFRDADFSFPIHASVGTIFGATTCGVTSE